MSYIIDTSKLEQIKHKVTSINENSTDLEYPSAKAVYTALEGFTPPHLIMRIYLQEN